MMRREKYACLEDHLRRVPAGTRRVWLTCAQIDELLASAGQGRLPASARKYQAWWANERGEGMHVQSAAWHRAGWQVAEVDLGAERVRFERQWEVE